MTYLNSAQYSNKLGDPPSLSVYGFMDLWVVQPNPGKARIPPPPFPSITKQSPALSITLAVISSHPGLHP